CSASTVSGPWNGSAVIAVSDFEEAVAVANDSEYGLVAGLFSENWDRINRLARSLDAGQIYVNEWFAGGVETPFGGYKASGIGREKGMQAMEHYTQTKTVSSRSYRE
ncbi:MAG: aldehyde dehydrogenase family protein, partial [Salinigranum sp.]